MSRPPGRDATVAMTRVLTLLTLLADAPALGHTTEYLVEKCGFGAASACDRSRQLNNELNRLRSMGWQIDNVARPGEQGRYRITIGDNRLRVQFTPAQTAALHRAASASTRSSLVGLVEGDRQALSSTTVRVRPTGTALHLDHLLRAVTHRCRVDFTYKDRRRSVHPYAVQSGPAGWYLVGREDGDELVKTFVAARMSDVEIRAPETAEPAPSQARASLDPLGWEIDPAVEVTVVTTSEHRLRVERLLGTPTDVLSAADRHALTYRVTHRAAFRARLYELGTRVRVEGPAEFREEMIAELERRAA